MITEAQQTALAYHCRLAGEIAHPRFGHYGLGYTIVLTLNSGYE